MSSLGLGSALMAAVPGLIDYVFAVPPKSSAHDRATKHMLANLSAVGLFAAARMARRNPDAAPPAWAAGLEVCGAGLLAVGGWMGGTLVYRNQIAVDHRYADAGKWHVESLGPEQLDGHEIDVGSADELKIDQMKLLRAGARRIVIARIESGHVAFDDRCTHKGGPLSDGALACGTVQCPWHGSQFDVTSGSVRRGPAAEPIATYEIRERDGRLWLTVPAESTPALEPLGTRA
jgi:nitrite reductase/ring-hydroxylating ferredoxin subunit